MASSQNFKSQKKKRVDKLVKHILQTSNTNTGLTHEKSKLNGHRCNLTDPAMREMNSIELPSDEDNKNDTRSFLLKALMLDSAQGPAAASVAAQCDTFQIQVQPKD